MIGYEWRIVKSGRGGTTSYQLCAFSGDHIIKRREIEYGEYGLEDLKYSIESWLAAFDKPVITEGT